MGEYATLPLSFLTFWFIQAPVGLIKFFKKLNKAFFDLFSLSLMLRTFFKPIKNEYRQGLVGFSIGMGIIIKTVLILFSFLLLIPLLVAEVALFLLFLSAPVLTILVLFL